jgi:hypothetical protein
MTSSGCFFFVDFFLHTVGILRVGLTPELLVTLLPSGAAAGTGCPAALGPGGAAALGGLTSGRAPTTPSPNGFTWRGWHNAFNPWGTLGWRWRHALDPWGTPGRRRRHSLLHWDPPWAQLALGDPWAAHGAPLGHHRRQLWAVEQPLALLARLLLEPPALSPLLQWAPALELVAQWGLLGGHTLRRNCSCPWDLRGWGWEH